MRIIFQLCFELNSLYRSHESKKISLLRVGLSNYTLNNRQITAAYVKLSFEFYHPSDKYNVKAILCFSNHNKLFAAMKLQNGQYM